MSWWRNKRFRVWVLIGALVSPASVCGPAAAQPTPGTQTVEITGATYVEFDEASAIWKAEGRPVRVSRGHIVLRALRVRYDGRARVVVGEGGVELTEPGMALFGDEAELRLADDWVRVAGAVRVISTREDPPAELRAPAAEGSLRTRRFSATGGVSFVRGEGALSGRRIDYDDTAQVAVVTGEPAARLKDAILTATTITLHVDAELLRGEGEAVVRRGDLAGTARRIEVRSREGVIRLVGDARVTRGRDWLTADEIEAALDGSRISTRGNSRAVVTPP